MKKFARLTATCVLLLIPFAAWAENWSWTETPTPGSQNKFVSEETAEEETYEDGTLSDMIFLSEVMPNPEGTDNDTEWIELYNAGNVNVDLGNWQLDDEEGGSAPYTFPAGSIIEAQDFLVIYRVDSKIALNNDKDAVRLINFQGNLKDSAEYDAAPEGQSYARIELEPIEIASAFQNTRMNWLIPQAHAAWYEGPWEWTEEVTQGTTNPIYYFLEGMIDEVIPFEDKVTLKKGEKRLDVSLKKLNLNPELKASIFQVGKSIQGYGTTPDGQTFELKRFETQSNESIATRGKTKVLRYALLTLLCGIGLLLRALCKRPLTTAK